MPFHLIAQLIACGFNGALMVFFGNYNINEKLLKFKNVLCLFLYRPNRLREKIPSTFNLFKTMVKGGG